MQRDLEDAIAYFRVSTDRQAQEGHGFDYYYRQLREYGFREDQIYSDIGSGGNNKRKGYQMVLARVRQGVKRVYVPDLSRFTRSVEGWEQAIQDLRLAGATLITLDSGQVRIDTPESVYMSRILVAQASYQREQNQYKALKGFEFKRHRGDAFRQRFPYKILKDRENGDRLIPNTDQYKDTDKTVWEIGLELVEEFIRQNGILTHTLRVMIDRYGIKQNRMDFTDFPNDHSSLRDWLLSEEIRGNLQYFAQTRRKPRDRSLGRKPKPEVLYNRHQPLITNEQSQIIYKLLNTSAASRRKAGQLINPLQNLMTCAGCGGKMRVSRSTTPARDGGVNYFYYVVCKNAYPNYAKKRIEQEKKGTFCDRRSSYGLQISDVEEAVIQALCDRSEAVAKAGAYVESDENPNNLEIVKLRSQIAKYEAMALEDPDIIDVLQKKRSDLEALEKSLNVESSELARARRDLVRFGGDPLFWLELTPQQRLLAYQDFVESVVLDKGLITIALRV